MKHTDKRPWIPVVFGLPFIGVGLFFTLTGFEVYPLPGVEANAPLWVLGCVGVTFLFAGLLVTGVGIVNWATAFRRGGVVRMHPNEPWLIDYEWDREKIRSAGFGGVVGGIFKFALLCTFLAPFHWWAWMSPEGGLMVKIIVGFFELFAGLFALAVLRGFARWLKYGRTQLRFAQFPYHPGERLEVEFSPNRFDRLHVELRFRRRVIERSGSGDATSTRVSTHTVHEMVQDVECSRLDAEVPIAFDLPDNGEWVNSIATEPSFYWEMEVKAEAPGIDFEETYMLPVYASPGVSNPILGSTTRTASAPRST